MKRSGIVLLLVLLAAPAVLAQPAHSVWSNKPFLVKDGATGAQYKTFVKGNAAFAWNAGTTTAYARAVGVITTALNYDFKLVSVTSTTADEIDGKFDVFRNGVNVCHLCIGKAYGLSQPAGASNYFKIYVGTPAAYAEKWLYSGYITSRFDF